ncbi:hypothetical protein TIFTF001_045320 [Ficus carica]|uniref:Uncharacterized protein n=1 Tax=Ficus carica TaxID=3494 RepID=A0AA87Z7A3_FICCA|nr:hypothetical protein TIFTF001_045320 [Ficus carica]
MGTPHPPSLFSRQGCEGGPRVGKRERRGKGSLSGGSVGGWGEVKRGGLGWRCRGRVDLGWGVPSELGVGELPRGGGDWGCRGWGYVTGVDGGKVTGYREDLGWEW